MMRIENEDYEYFWQLITKGRNNSLIKLMQYSSKVNDIKILIENREKFGLDSSAIVEFRLPNGTINPNTWIENINLFLGIVRCAHELSIIQEKPEERRTESERKMLEKFEILQTGRDEEQILEALIELCIAPEQRKIYIDRYMINKPLLDNSPEIEKAITSKISTNKIGKKIFVGKDAVNGGLSTK